MTPGKRFKGYVWLLIAVLPAMFCLVPSVYADQAEEYWNKGEELYETHHLAPGRFEEALEWYEKAVALRKKDYTFLWEISKRYQIYGQSLGKEQKKRKLRAWKKGLEYGRRAVEVNPDGKEGHFYYMANLGAIAQLKGAMISLWRFPKIKGEMDRTLEIDPDYPPALAARAQYLLEMPLVFGGDRQEAMRLCKRVIELDPGYLPVYVTVARLLAEEGRYDGAVAALDNILECKNPRQYANYVKVDRPRAEEALKEIMEQKPGPD